MNKLQLKDSSEYQNFKIHAFAVPNNQKFAKRVRKSHREDTSFYKFFNEFAWLGVGAVVNQLELSKLPGTQLEYFGKGGK